MFMAGPRMVLMSSAWHSSPRVSPSVFASSRSKLAATAQPAGKQTARILSLSPRWSASPLCLRSPWGPSETDTAGIPRRSTPFVLQKSAPEQSPAFSSSVICEMRCLIFSLFIRSLPFLDRACARLSVLIPVF